MLFSLIFAAHLPVGGLFESQVLPPGWLLRNQLNGVDGRMRRGYLLEDMQRRYVSVREQRFGCRAVRDILRGVFRERGGRRRGFL